MYDNPKNLELLVELPLEDDKFISLQQQDPKIWDLCDKVKGGMHSEFYLIINNVLFRSIVDNGHKFKAKTARIMHCKRLKKLDLKNKILNQVYNPWNSYVWT